MIERLTVTESALDFNSAKLNTAVNLVSVLNSIYWQYRINWKKDEFYPDIFPVDRLGYKDARQKIAEFFPEVSQEAFKILASKKAFESGLWNINQLAINWDNPDYESLRLVAEGFGVTDKEIEVIALGVKEIQRKENNLFRINKPQKQEQKQ